MSDIRDDARQEAERRWPGLRTPGGYLTPQHVERDAFEAGAVWASEQPDRESAPETAVYVGVRDIALTYDEGSGDLRIVFRHGDYERTVEATAAPPAITDRLVDGPQPDREPSALRSHVRDLTGETDRGLTEVGGFRGERHDTTETGSVAPPSDADLVSVSWFDCDCGFSKPCAESHRKRARVPRAILAAQEVRHVS